MLQAGPANVRLTRFLYVAPCFCATLPKQSHCLPRHRHRIPRCDNTMPFASIWLGLGLALTSIHGNHKLTLKNVCRTRHTTMVFTGILPVRLSKLPLYVILSSVFKFHPQVILVKSCDTGRYTKIGTLPHLFATRRQGYLYKEWSKVPSGASYPTARQQREIRL